jgi:putative oxidoreductase
MFSQSREDTAKLILRITISVLMLFHGVPKLLHGVTHIEGMLQGHGLPGFFAYAVFLGEIVGPVLLLLGWYARVGALLIVVNMVVAILLVHTGDLFTLTERGSYRLEVQAFFLFTALALALIGPGRYRIGSR